MSVRSTIIENAEKEYQALQKLERGSKEYVATANVANDITDRLIKMNELECKQRQLDIEEKQLEIEADKANSNKKFDKVNLAANIGMFTVSVGVAIWQVISSQHHDLKGGMYDDAGRDGVKKNLSFMSKFLKR